MKKYKRLFWRLYPSYLLITLISLLAVSIYTSLAIQDFFMEKTGSDLIARAKLLENQIMEHLLDQDYTAIDAICKIAGRLSQTRITVLINSGKVIGDSEEDPDKMDDHSQRPEINKALRGDKGSAARYSQTVKKNMMYVAVPVEKQGKILCVIRTSVPVDSIDKELKKLQLRKLIAGIIIAFIAAWVSLIVSRLISRPIEDMRKGAEQFAQGNLSYRLATPKSREMVMLANAMNQMASDLYDRIQTVSSQRNELEAVLSSMSEGVIAVDPDERVININQAAARMFHKVPDKLVGKTIQEVIRNPQLHRFIKESLSGEEPEEKDIIFYLDEEYILNTHSSTLCGAKGEHMGILVVFHDVTRLRRLENMRRDFAANVSHEIKTPLTAIKGFVETLNSGAIDQPDEARRFLEIIDKHANRLTAIIDDLMKLSEIEQKGQISLEQAEILPVIKNAVEMCQINADRKNIKIMLECNEKLTANINAPFFEQAVVNLADNAIKYSPEHSIVNISAEKSDSRLIIKFKDQGIGIPKNHLPRLFERFYRVDKSRSRKQGGTGLGLAIVKHIIQAHGGTITAHSTIGQGSVFEIQLPKYTEISKKV
ncbi:Two component system response regulator/histidine kinase, PAS domain-containing [Desulfonema limicola]|uniref:histidine kinase n=1 Tax=Desulfonema limicola TaxID=45656 RepID=A0A975GH40_9BACT|nr:ATP-binding protein [Desulfonema limicola]QTA80848.1 Two component system response regulator/histidine kinase, PAS domain-containing [Desulfonema limicola]